MAGTEWNQIRLGLILMDKGAWTLSWGSGEPWKILSREVANQIYSLSRPARRWGAGGGEASTVGTEEVPSVEE